jgi:hypothetical protein
MAISDESAIGSNSDEELPSARRPEQERARRAARVIHYATAENLEHVDVALIDRAEHEIDLAAYVLMDLLVTPAFGSKQSGWAPQ